MSVQGVADRGDRLARVENSRTALYFRVAAQLVRVHHAAGQQQPVVVVRFRLGDGDVHREGLAPIRVIPGAKLAAFGGYDVRCCACIVQRASRTSEFFLLKPICDQDRDGLVFKFVRHSRCLASLYQMPARVRRGELFPRGL